MKETIPSTPYWPLLVWPITVSYPDQEPQVAMIIAETIDQAVNTVKVEHFGAQIGMLSGVRFPQDMQLRLQVEKALLKRMQIEPPHRPAGF